MTVETIEGAMIVENARFCLVVARFNSFIVESLLAGAILAQALDALDADRDFLKAGGVFDDDLIDGYIALKMDEVTRFRMSTHPVEFDMYYSI